MTQNIKINIANWSNNKYIITLQGVSPAASLLISFVGYYTKEVKASANGRALKITLEE